VSAYGGRFDPTGPTCGNGARYGNAVLVRTAQVRLVGSWLLPNPAGGETRRLMCLDARPDSTASLVACVTHISYVGGNIAPQVNAVAGILHGLARTRAVLLGGDFNAAQTDPRLDRLYSPCYRTGTGDFEEADSARCASRSATNRSVGFDIVNEDTQQRRKLDYIFLSSGHWATRQADARDGAARLSDHDALWATTTLRATAD
jgi:endonuclease/exonuclease/phosphatase family metal-dependent hydrolase